MKKISTVQHYRTLEEAAVTPADHKANRIYHGVIRENSILSLAYYMVMNKHLPGLFIKTFTYRPKGLFKKTKTMYYPYFIKQKNEKLIIKPLVNIKGLKNSNTFTARALILALVTAQKVKTVIEKEPSVIENNTAMVKTLKETFFLEQFIYRKTNNVSYLTLDALKNVLEKVGNTLYEKINTKA